LQRRQGWGPVSDAQLAEGLSLARQAIETGKDDADALWMGGTSSQSAPASAPPPPVLSKGP
jgi:hypothetical protein